MPRCRPASVTLTLLLAAAASACAPSAKLSAPPAEPEQKAQLGAGAARGKWVFSVAGCSLCHGAAGKGGVKNRNSETGGEINGLTLVKEAYSAKELAQKIREGVREVGRADPHGPVPPLRMPAYGSWLSDQSINDLVAYLFTLYPKGSAKGDDGDDDDSDTDEDSKPGATPKQGASSKPKAGSKPDGASKKGGSEEDDDADETDHPAKEPTPKR